MDQRTSLMEDYIPSGPIVESVRRYYANGGFHPVNIGDTFNDRYRVVKKLGFGSHSTVWLVQDLILNRFASLKIISASMSSSSSELSISGHLKSLQEQNITHPGREHIVRIFDTFIIQGPNGTHHCIVTEILGISLASDVGRFYGRSFPEDVTKRVVGQVALAVDYLHKCGVIHGDLHLRNVLFYSPKLNIASLEELDSIYSQSRHKNILLKDDTLTPPSAHLPQALIGVRENLRLFELCLSSVEDIHVKLCDFGEATIINSTGSVGTPFQTRMPRVFAAPEIMFKDISSPTTSMEIWVLGVLLFMIINGKHPPFEPDGGFGEVDEEIIEEMVVQLGKPPERWRGKWPERAKLFDDAGNAFDEYRRRRPRGVEGILSLFEFSNKECESFTLVMSKIFRYEPEERIDSQEVVRLLPEGWVDSQALEKLNLLSKSDVINVLMADKTDGVVALED